MSSHYPNLLSPISIRSTVLRNRMVSTASTPHFLQGTEKEPREKIITHFGNRAKSGAAAVTVNHFHRDMMPMPGRAIDNPPMHFNLFDIEDAGCQNYMCQLIDTIHFYGSKATAYLMPDSSWFYPDGKLPAGMDGGMPPPMEPREPDSTQVEQRRGPMAGPPGEIRPDQVTEEMIGNYIAYAAREAQELSRLGFDIISVHTCYRRSPHTQFLSPLTNHRTDGYGAQSVETRARFTLELFRAIRSAVGAAAVLEAVISVDEEALGGYTLEDTIGFCKLADGLIDVIHLRSGEMDPQHPIGFTSTEDRPAPFLEQMGEVARAVHGLGLQEVVMVSSGFQDPDLAERAIAEGKADLVGFARAWINNEDFGQKVLEGRKEDIVPCIRCNKCHVPNGRDMWRSVCSVNPRVGLEDRLDQMVRRTKKRSRCAVVGGGPAGMEFARIAAQQGHEVTLFEAADALGGNLRHADHPSFKWPLRQFKDFMAGQMERLGVEVRLNTPATRQLIQAGGYDVVAVAVGSEPVRPSIPGADRENVHFAAAIYGRLERELSDELVLIGGGEIGVETALYLCELGKRVTVLEAQPELIADAPHAHYKDMVRAYWKKQPNFSYQCGVHVTAIEADGVCFTDRQGQEQKCFCGDVLLSVGARPLTEHAMEFSGCAPRMYVIGDCDRVANVQRAMRSAFGAALSL